MEQEDILLLLCFFFFFFKGNNVRNVIGINRLENIEAPSRINRRGVGLSIEVQNLIIFE